MIYPTPFLRHRIVQLDLDFILAKEMLQILKLTYTPNLPEVGNASVLSLFQQFEKIPPRLGLCLILTRKYI